jgi:hypothetical protein
LVERFSATPAVVVRLKEVTTVGVGRPHLPAFEAHQSQGLDEVVRRQPVAAGSARTALVIV